MWRLAKIVCPLLLSAGVYGRMLTMTDHELLRDYAQTGAEAAFAELVRRHVALVHSAALRQVRDAHAAEEITQAVFIVLARKAARLGPNTVLAGWLLKAARYAVSTHIRATVRRTRREQEAAMQATLNEPAAEAQAWEQLAPHLDDALAALGEADRAAIALRYFEKKTAGEIAAALKVNEVAAQKRISRALEKLRNLFHKRGVVLQATLIASAVSANAVQAAPASVAVAVATVAKGVGATESIAVLAGGTLKLMSTGFAKAMLLVLFSPVLSGLVPYLMMRSLLRRTKSERIRALHTWLAWRGVWSNVISALAAVPLGFINPRIHPWLLTGAFLLFGLVLFVAVKLQIYWTRLHEQELKRLRAEEESADPNPTIKS